MDWLDTFESVFKTVDWKLGPIGLLCMVVI